MSAWLDVGLLGQAGLVCAPCVDLIDVMFWGALAVGVIAGALALGIPAGVVGVAFVGGIAFGVGMRVGESLAESYGSAGDPAARPEDSSTWTDAQWERFREEEEAYWDARLEGEPEWVKGLVKSGELDPQIWFDVTEEERARIREAGSIEAGVQSLREDAPRR